MGAVIDLGTNTFHLLIAERQADGQLNTLYRERRFVRLGENGIQTIGQAPYQRAVETITAFAKKIREYGLLPEQVKAVGTAGMRTASNGPTLIQEMQTLTGIRVQLIDGAEEARLIHQGVSLAIPPGPQPRLIMDIGGGSVEFIIDEESGVRWSQSFPIGVSVLFDRFHESEPIAPEEVDALKAFLKDTLSPLEKALSLSPCHSLIGSSGTFDVLEQFSPGSVRNGLSAEVPMSEFHPFYDRILNMNMQQRRAIPDMPAARADMLSVALVLLSVVVDMAGIQQILVSDYALKEGVLGGRGKG